MTRFLTLALPAVLLAGCVTGQGEAPGTVSAADLTGTSWTFASIDGGEPKSDLAKASFEADRLSFTAGCNGMGGEWKVEADRLVGGPYMSTMMFCDGLMEQERALAALLEEKPRIVLMGDRMVLEGTAHRAQLVRSGS